MAVFLIHLIACIACIAGKPGSHIEPGLLRDSAVSGIPGALMKQNALT